MDILTVLLTLAGIVATILVVLLFLLFRSMRVQRTNPTAETVSAPEPLAPEAIPAPPPATPQKKRDLPLSPELSAALATATQELTATDAAIQHLPPHLRERVTMRAEMMAVEHVIERLRYQAQAGGSLHGSLAVEMQRATDRLKRIRVDATRIAEEVETLAVVQYELARDSAALHATLEQLSRHALVSIAWGELVRNSIAALAVVEQQQAIEPTGSYDVLKRELLRARGLLSDISEGRRYVVEVQAQHAALCTVLERPELAVDPAWYQAFQRIRPQTRAVGQAAVPPQNTALTELLTEADALIDRRRRLFQAGTLLPDGAVRIPDHAAEPALREAQAIQRTALSLVQRARALAAARRQTASA
ncbi:MAG: hypothetical protein HC822_19700 [Oscillochloris sp.]|nr:hypothetical protein [Oscillochloris sp.]